MRKCTWNNDQNKGILTGKKRKQTRSADGVQKLPHSVMEGLTVGGCALVLAVSSKHMVLQSCDVTFYSRHITSGNTTIFLEMCEFFCDEIWMF